MSVRETSADLTRVPRAAELNRLLLIIRDLDAGEGVTKTALFERASSICFGGVLPDNESTLSFAAKNELLRRTGSRWRLSRLGRELLAANPRGSYEVTVTQRVLLAERCVFSGPYQALARQVVAQFGMAVNSDTWTTEYSRHRALDHVGRSLVSFMVGVGVLKVRPDGLEVATEYLPSVSRLRSRRPQSVEDLDEALRRQRDKGERAEQWVVGYERRRLAEIGCPAEANAVRQISRVDVCAGYDVGSFDGPSSSLSFDRFIEVKSTSADSFGFFWSQNEIATAQVLGARYWLYIVRLQDGPSVALVRVRNPASLINTAEGIVLEPSVFRGVVSRFEPEYVELQLEELTIPLNTIRDSAD